MSDRYELQLLEQSIRRGRWGFTFLPVIAQQAAFQQNDLLSVYVDDAMARTWAITLASFKYAGGVPIIANRPLDNQTIAQPRVRAQLTWGVNGGTDTAIVDYYSRGCCFQVQASTIRLGLFSEGGFTPGTPIPNLGGWVTPMPRFAVVDMAPTYTTPLAVIAAAGQAFLFPIPARATAYRWFAQNYAGAPNQVTLFQVQENGATLTQQDATIPQAPPSAENLQGNRQGYMPLNPVSQWVQVTNNDPTNNITMGLQFLLDLG